MANSNQSNSMGSTGTLLAGMAMGAGAMLLANKSVREKITGKLENLKDMTQDKAEDLTDAARASVKKMTKNASDKISDATK